jgi:hypothetical protein
MPKNGIKPLTKLPKRNFHEHFGGTINIPDFHLDVGLLNQNQEADGKDTECTSYYITNTFTNRLMKTFEPGFSYGATMFTENVQPTTEGADPLAALQSAVICGALPTIYCTQEELAQSEIMDANFSNWATQQQLALQTCAVDVHNVLGFTDPFNSILSTMWTGQVAVAICTPWYEEWMTAPNGVLPMPANVNNVSGLPWHCYSGEGKETISEKEHIVTKPWIGASWGANGFGYLSQEVCNAVMSVPGAGALVLVFTGKRWLPLCKIVVNRPWTIGYAMPRLLQFGV